MTPPGAGQGTLDTAYPLLTLLVPGPRGLWPIWRCMDTSTGEVTRRMRPGWCRPGSRSRVGRGVGRPGDHPGGVRAVPGDQRPVVQQVASKITGGLCDGDGRAAYRAHLAKYPKGAEVPGAVPSAADHRQRHLVEEEAKLLVPYLSPPDTQPARTPSPRSG